ncbi:hypothetical protein [Paenirhodobacter populi]|uniref:hypothetical protein n=1 Tax=Paenirhodobacter populi TaxID=2306993 RepID=UPI0013E36016|nr:hypothetical protein [Sinirhodobacter populi]
MSGKNPCIVLDGYSLATSIFTANGKRARPADADRRGCAGTRALAPARPSDHAACV